MAGLILVSALLVSDLTPEQQRLLNTFRGEFVAITPGKGQFPAIFGMGGSQRGRLSEAPAHQVSIAYEFEIGRYEVTQELWEAVMGSNPSRWKGPRNSVEMLSFADAQAFCERVTSMLRAAGMITDNQLVRLPTEAEWEYACRAGTSTSYSFGDDPGQLGRYAWFHGNAAGNDPPVGAKQPNAWGLYDVHGYLWEWCLDTEHLDYSGAPRDGSAWIEGGTAQSRIVRGGSWKDPAEHLTSSYRHSLPEDQRDDAVGLRCVLATRTPAAAR